MSTFVFAPSWISYPNKPKRTDDHFPSSHCEHISENTTTALKNEQHYPPLVTKSTKTNTSNNVWSNAKLIRKIHSPTDQTTDDDSDDDHEEVARASVAATRTTEWERLKALVPKTTKKNTCRNSFSTSDIATTTITTTRHHHSKHLKQTILSQSTVPNTLTNTKSTTLNHSLANNKPIGTKKRLPHSHSAVLWQDSSSQRQQHKDETGRLQPPTSTSSSPVITRKRSIAKDEVVGHAKAAKEEAVTVKGIHQKSNLEPTSTMALKEDVISEEEQQSFICFIKAWTTYGTLSTSSLVDGNTEAGSRKTTRQPLKTYYSYFNCYSDSDASLKSNHCIHRNSHCSNGQNPMTSQTKSREHADISHSLINTRPSTSNSYFYYNPFHL
ncbi:hypothetical protein BDF20DRAFT_879218 [Mycotypha africana]|uniref:uncharacterized protein n=1 Tax=Mycotypha africana TaxID=64632 RepID=UPI00230038CC|nr:uncharacterized protein BDF20DRAFT_879218 [Mycotypha africana]KAI8975536.1 hypothetical protein BDF20DRAFT_879218 [Mycotypha africana]